ncbi:MAG: PHP domain-containing protein, partial [Alistipes sp.]|nr:PHP domain-containing protein [Alistipes sp.]
MSQFVHLHVHSQYSILDGQASIQRLVDKALADGQPGIALTDHGNMFGVKEFYNYVKKVNDKKHDKIKSFRQLLDGLNTLLAEHPDPKQYAADLKKQLTELEPHSTESLDTAEQYAKLKERADEVARMEEEFGFDAAAGQQKIAALEAVPDFKPIVGCEVYVARRRLQDKEGKPDQSGYHLILLAKNLTGYHNLIKIVSKAWTDGFYMRPRTDHAELEKHHEGLICCSACLAGEVPRAITADDMEKAEEAIRWHKKLFGDDYYLELQLHKATVERANHEAYPMQIKVNEQLRRLAAKYNVRTICTNDVHFVDEDNAEAHDRLICLSTGKDLDDPKRMLYSKQEWLKTTAEMAAIFGETDAQAMATTVDICNQVEFYSIDHAPIMPTFEIPAEFGTEEEYRQRFTEQQLFDEFTRDENGNVIMSEDEGRKKIEKLGGYDKLYRIKFEADYLEKLTMDGARRRYG